MRLLCDLIGVWYSLRTWVPTTALGWFPVDGHDYRGEPWGTLTCARCGRVEPEDTHG